MAPKTFEFGELWLSAFSPPAKASPALQLLRLPLVCLKSQSIQRADGAARRPPGAPSALRGQSRDLQSRLQSPKVLLEIKRPRASPNIWQQEEEECGVSVWAGRKQRQPFTRTQQSPEKVSTSWLSARPRTETSSRHSFLFSASGSDKPLLLSKAPKQISGSLEQQASETPNTSRGLKMLSLDGGPPTSAAETPGRSAPQLTALCCKVSAVSSFNEWGS